VLRLVDKDVLMLCHGILLLHLLLLTAVFERHFSCFVLLLLLVVCQRAACRLKGLTHELDKGRVRPIVDPDEPWHLDAWLEWSVEVPL